MVRYLPDAPCTSVFLQSLDGYAEYLAAGSEDYKTYESYCGEVRTIRVTFEPLFDDPGTVDLSGINWIVVGTMTGAQSRKIHTEPEWAWSLTNQAHALGIPVFMKEDLVPIIGDENMIQEMPEEFNKVLEVQRSWQK